MRNLKVILKNGSQAWQSDIDCAMTWLRFTLRYNQISFRVLYRLCWCGDYEAKQYYRTTLIESHLLNKDGTIPSLIRVIIQSSVTVTVAGYVLDNPELEREGM